jgi:hypothetical protein
MYFMCFPNASLKRKSLGSPEVPVTTPSRVARARDASAASPAAAHAAARRRPRKCTRSRRQRGPGGRKSVRSVGATDALWGVISNYIELVHGGYKAICNWGIAPCGCDQMWRMVGEFWCRNMALIAWQIPWPTPNLCKIMMSHQTCAGCATFRQSQMGT